MLARIMFGFAHKKEKPLRQQLLEARENVAHQLSIMASGPINNNTRWQSDSIAELQRILEQLNEQIADLEPNDAKGS